MTLAQSHYGFEQHSPEDTDDLFGTADDLDQFDEKPSLAPSRRTSSGVASRKGSSPGAADKRATHNAIERARRESLNGRFMTLAEALPSMANVKRPSKSIIVNKALDFVFDAQVKEHALIKENNELRKQVDQLRARLGMAPLPPPSPLPGSSTAADTKKRPHSHRSASIPNSFTSAKAEGFADEMGAAMGGSTVAEPVASASYTSSPASTHGMDQNSPSSALSMGVPSPTSTVDTPPVSTVSTSPFVQPQMFVAPATMDPNDVSSPSSTPANNPMMFANHLNALAVAQAQAQLGMMGAVGGAGYMNPQSLLSQQHTLLLAAHLQHQQQMQAQHQQPHSHHGHMEMGFGGQGMAWNGQQAQQQASTAGYSPLDPYATFMA